MPDETPPPCRPDMAALVATYADAVGRFGPDSREARTIREMNADDAEFLDYADALDRVKRHLGGSGMQGEAPTS